MFVVQDMLSEVFILVMVLVIAVLALAAAAAVGRDWLERRRGRRVHSLMRRRILHEYASACAPPMAPVAATEIPPGRRRAPRSRRVPIDAGDHLFSPPAKA